MDSMRSLNKSLPRARQQPDVHQSFRTAALTVTNLYKSALADLDRARADGYQDALDDLLAFLDKENMGVGDGEGWRIRQWATERLDGAQPKQPSSDTDDDDVDDDKHARSSSPVMERQMSPEETREPQVVDSTSQSDPAPPLHVEASMLEPDTSPLHHVFQFSASQPYPQNTPNDLAVSDFSAAARRAFPAPRRSSNRSSSRNLQRSAAQNLFQLGQLGNGAGQKRKAVQDFFSLDSFNDRRDGSAGGPKRGRMT